MNMDKNDGWTTLDSGLIVPEGVDKKSTVEAPIEKVESFAEARVAEIAKEAKVVTPEDPEKKAAQIEALRLDIISPSFENTDNLTEELKNEHIIRRVYDFDTLMSAIDKVGDITGSDGHVYKPDYLKDVIGEVFMGRKQLNYVTGTFGLRDKVRSLLEAQQSEMDRRTAEQSKSPEEKMKDKIFESEEIRRLREYRDRAERVEPKEEKKRRSLFNR